MTTATISSPPAAPPLQKETTAGGYFIANYPPFSPLNSLQPVEPT